MCYSRSLNNRLKNLHERTLRIVYQDKKLHFQTLRRNDKSVTVYLRNLHYLTTEFYKVKNNISADITERYFTLPKK